MKRRFPPEADVVEAAGLQVYLRPSPDRVPLRIGARPETTGLPEPTHTVLVENRRLHIWLDVDTACACLQRMITTLKEYAPRRARVFEPWLAESVASPQVLAERIANVQEAFVGISGMFAALPDLLAPLATAGTAALLAVLVADALSSSQQPPVGAAFLAAAVTWGLALAGRLWPGDQHPFFTVAALAPVPVFAFQRASGIPEASYWLALSAVVSAAALGVRVLDLMRRELRPPPPDPIPDCPHVDYSGTRAPSSYANCKYLEGSAYRPVGALWNKAQGFWANHGPAPSFALGGIHWPLETSAEHCIYIGVTGSGKSLSLLGALKGLAPHMQSVVYDHKSTFYSSVAGALPEGEDGIALLHPLDVRGLAWDLAEDLTNPLATHGFAASLTRTAERESFWKTSGTAGLAAVFDVLNELRPRDWTLLDAVHVTSQRLLRRFLESSPPGRHFLETLLTSESATGDRPGDVMATMSAFMTRLLPVALATEALYQAGRTFSIAAWERAETRQRCIILGHSPNYKQALQPYTRALMDQIGSRLLAHAEIHTTPRALLMVDELQSSPEFDLSELLTNGREKGITVWMATQDIPGLAALYSREIADSIVGSVRHQIFLRSSCDITADKASALAGTQTFVREQVSRSWSESEARSEAGGELNRTVTTSVGEQATPGVFTEKLLQPSVTLNFPKAGPEAGLVGYFRRGGLQWVPSLHWDWVLDQIPQRAPVPDYVPMAVDELHYEPWDEADLEKFLGGADERADDFFGDL